MKVQAILELNTGKGVEFETDLLTQLGIPPEKVFIGYYDGKRNPRYLVNDISEAFATAYDYDQHSIVILLDDNAMIVDMLTGSILLKGKWVNVGSVEPDTNEWTYDQTTDSYWSIS